MNTLVRIALAFFLVFALIVFLSAGYTIDETEQVILTQFGAPVGQPITEAGLHFKIPLIQTANKIDKRILEWDGPPSDIPTKDKLYISVDTFARWRIVDPLLYFQRMRTERDAQSRLDDILDGEARNIIARYDLLEIIRTSNRQPEVDQQFATVAEIGQLKPISVGREKIAQMIFESASKRLTGLGIELLDIRFKRINYNPAVQDDIYRRMISERNQIAEKFRSEGEGEAARIRGQMDKELKQIQSEAYLTIQNITGKADAEATAIYAKAYNQSAEAAQYYQFLKTLETYETTLGKDAMLILTTDSEIFGLLKSSHVSGNIGDSGTAPAAFPPSTPTTATQPHPALLNR